MSRFVRKRTIRESNPTDSYLNTIIPCLLIPAILRSNCAHPCAKVDSLFTYLTSAN